MVAPWEGVVSIPEGEVGVYKIQHFTRPAGKIPRRNFRTTMYGGQVEGDLEFDHETTWHQLSYDGGVWMTDLPIEQAQHDNELRDVQGRVLIGGLGIGYAVNVLAARPDVDEIVVVELAPEVIALVGEHVRDPDGKVTIVQADLFDYLREHQEADETYFDWGFFDIWQSDGEGTFHDTVVPLRRHSEDWIDKVVCWNENVMRGQLTSGLHSRWAMVSAVLAADAAAAEATDPLPKEHGMLIERFREGGANLDALTTALPEDHDYASYRNWAVPFWESVRDGKVDAESFTVAAAAYAWSYGETAWGEEWAEMWRRWLEVGLPDAMRRQAETVLQRQSGQETS